ncbi:MAG: zinc ribbon domain-containing protein [Nitrospinae bacterium]|nr:zinc ribbon domain-containing protein [Nitrospinota bacterium]
MPIYEYICSQCSNRFEIMHLSSKMETAICPKCSSNKIEKLMSSFAAMAPSESIDSCDTGSCNYTPPGGYPPCRGGSCNMM